MRNLVFSNIFISNRMSNMSSPSRRSVDNDPFYDTDFTADISHKMRVPKHITASGDAADDRQDHWIRSTDFQEKFEMYVPDRILVVGQEQHIGTKAPPRELQLENAVMPPDPGFIRVQTPPRVISLDEHFIPAADEPTFNHQREFKNSPPTLNGFVSRNDYNKKMDITLRETTPPNGTADISMNMTGLTPAEEVLHLRRQVVKLSRRVMAVELDLQQQQQRQQILLGLGIAYFLVKSVVWITRSS
ncbi:transport and Golgi organization protein 11 isoform X1 [Neocloeon triangulifer]|uniref:transport and Golgi organization protein 11 isoform X1 n=2 Tax=Neocloeon triangulifer TaxID=2078957 RepID=UPI00286F8575|nr:transport and Golgi organization protein 11 isoform X1 [Neocloeon triangulifer]